MECQLWLWPVVLGPFFSERSDRNFAPLDDVIVPGRQGSACAIVAIQRAQALRQVLMRFTSTPTAVTAGFISRSCLPSLRVGMA